MARSRRLTNDKDPAEVFPVSFDFTGDLADGETVASTDVTVTVIRGSDEDPSAFLSGADSESDGVVTQTITGGINEVDYKVKATITTSASRVYALAIIVPVRTL